MKKRLFISSILMTLVLLVAITTATFAWYTAQSTYKTKKVGADTGTINVTSNAVEASDLKTTINMVVEEETFSSGKPLLLSSWEDTDDNSLDEVHVWELFTATTDTETSVTTHRAKGSGDVFYRVYKVSLYIENSTPVGTATAEEWAAALAASNKTVNYTFSAGSLTGLTSNEVKFYYVNQGTGSAPAIDHDLEDAGANSTTAVAINTLSQDSAAPTQIGYLIVRIEGSLNNHSANSTYSVIISAAGEANFS